jgi:AP2 domain/HNH endonuclease
MQLMLDGCPVIIDEEDAPRVLAHTWHARRNPNQTYLYKTGSIFLHRFIMGIEKGDPRFVDHKNMNTLDNRKENLRICTKTQNQGNIRKYRNNTSGFKGVTRNLKSGRPWAAQIAVNHKHYGLGCYNTPEEAHQAYCVAAKKYFGEFARTE